MGEFSRQPLDPGFSGVPHGFWTLELPKGAQVLLGWLHSHTDQYLEGVTCNVARRALRTSQVVPWLKELQAAGFLLIYPPEAKGERTSYVLLSEPWEQLFGPRRNRRADIGAVGAPGSAREGDHLEDQEKKTSSPTASAEHEEMFERFWKSYPKDRGTKKPAKAAFLRALRRGHEEQVRSGLKAWLVKWGGDTGFVPYAEKWLNTEAYMNPPKVAATGRPVEQDLDAEDGVFHADGTPWPKWSKGYRGSDENPSWTDRRGNVTYEDPTL